MNVFLSAIVIGASAISLLQAEEVAKSRVKTEQVQVVVKSQQNEVINCAFNKPACDALNNVNIRDEIETAEKIKITRINNIWH